jgi:hypothetical protein
LFMTDGDITVNTLVFFKIDAELKYSHNLSAICA